MAQDISKEYKHISLIRPQTATSTVTGTGVDLMGYNDDCVAYFDLGAASGTGPSCIVTIETSPDNSTWTVRTTFSTADDTSDNKSACAKVTLDGTNRRYIRAVATIAGTTPSFAITVGCLVNAEYQTASLNSATLA